MLLFRSGDTAFYDLNSDIGAQHFAGHRLGCWINAIPANGLVMIPEASAGCVCQFSIASTIVMEPRIPRHEWTIHSAVGLKTPVESMRINFGAPGDRKDSDGNVWFSYPRRKAYQETSLDVAMDLKTEFFDEAKYTSINDSEIPSSTKTPWLYSSAADGLRKFQLPLLGPEDAPSHYRARLHFLATHETSETVFDVKVQGMVVLKDVALDAVTDKFKPMDVDIPSIPVTDHLIIEFVPRKGNPRINAIEVLRTE